MLERADRDFYLAFSNYKHYLCGQERGTDSVITTHWGGLDDKYLHLSERVAVIENALDAAGILVLTPTIYVPDSANDATGTTVVWKYKVKYLDHGQPLEFWPVVAAHFAPEARGRLLPHVTITTGLVHSMWHMPVFTKDYKLEIRNTDYKELSPDRSMWDSFWARLGMLGPVHKSRVLLMRKDIGTREQHDAFMTCVRSGVLTQRKRKWQSLMKDLPPIGKRINMIELFTLLTSLYGDGQVWKRGSFFGKIMDHMLLGVQPLGAKRVVYRTPIKVHL